MIVVSPVAIDPATPEEVLDHFKNMGAPFALHNYESRLALPAQRHLLISLDCATEAAFTVDEADDPLLESWPFLLIVRTRWIFTNHLSNPIK